MTKQGPTVLVIMDGWGHREDIHNNSIATSHTPTFDMLMEQYPHDLLDASDTFIGLPKGQMGNSEIGHMTIGSGKILDVDLVRINKAIEQGDFYTNQAFTQLFDHVKAHNSMLHIMGLVSPGGVHSHRDHLYAFLQAAKKADLPQVAIHAFTDGRDVAPTSAAEYLQELQDVIEDVGIGFVATIQGRFYAMDRDKNWDRIHKVEEAMLYGKGRQYHAEKPAEVIKKLYQEDLVDELMEPIVFLDDNGTGYQIQDNDGVFFFNFRADRARQISQKIASLQSEKNVMFVTMTQYSKEIESTVAFPPHELDTTLAAEIARAGKTQAHVAETEKYAHVTYFFNGGNELLHEGERHILLDSRKDIETHDQAPEMRAADITKEVLEEIDKGTDFIVVNYANADMVGHTANVEAIKIAVETVDNQLKALHEKLQAVNGVMIITADHGNAEKNYDEVTHQKHTAHTTNPVPCIITKQGLTVREHGTLADIAPTVLELMGLPECPSMDGTTLLSS